jgi:hypothetical protein
MNTASPWSRFLEKGPSLKLSEIGSSSRSIKAIMHEASREAQAQGLTEEVLREILDEQ